jgi:hypothetical protein
VGKFKISYKTSKNKDYNLTITKGFDYVGSSAENSKINAAARAILTANIIDDQYGDLEGINSIKYFSVDVTTYDVTD